MAIVKLTPHIHKLLFDSGYEYYSIKEVVLQPGTRKVRAMILVPEQKLPASVNESYTWINDTMITGLAFESFDCNVLVDCTMFSES